MENKTDNIMTKQTKALKRPPPPTENKHTMVHKALDEKNTELIACDLEGNVVPDPLVASVVLLMLKPSDKA